MTTDGLNKVSGERAAETVAPARDRVAGEVLYTERNEDVGVRVEAVYALIETIKAEVVEILKTGNSAQKLYVRVSPDGSVDVSEETSWCCSPDEYYKRIPHKLSLEILNCARDYSHLSANEIEACAENAEEAADEIMDRWAFGIDAWIAAGNLESVDAQDAVDILRAAWLRVRDGGALNA